MGNQGNEIHFGGSGNPRSAWNRDHGKGEITSKHAGSVMIPQIAQYDQRFEMLCGQDTKVSHPHTEAREDSVQELVEIIKRSKQQRFRPPASLRKNCLCAMSVAIITQELYDSFRCILAIGIHHDHGVRSEEHTSELQSL